MSLHLSISWLVAFPGPEIDVLAAKMPRLQDMQQSLNDSVAILASLLNSTSMQAEPDLANCFPLLQLRFRWSPMQHDSCINSHCSPISGSRASKISALVKLESTKSQESNCFISNLQPSRGFCNARWLPKRQHLSNNRLCNASKFIINDAMVNDYFIFCFGYYNCFSDWIDLLTCLFAKFIIVASGWHRSGYSLQI